MKSVEACNVDEKFELYAELMRFFINKKMFSSVIERSGSVSAC